MKSNKKFNLLLLKKIRKQCNVNTQSWATNLPASHSRWTTTCVRLPYLYERTGRMNDRTASTHYESRSCCFQQALLGSQHVTYLATRPFLLLHRSVFNIPLSIDLWMQGLSLIYIEWQVVFCLAFYSPSKVLIKSKRTNLLLAGAPVEASKPGGLMALQWTLQLKATYGLGYACTCIRVELRQELILA